MFDNSNMLKRKRIEIVGTGNDKGLSYFDDLSNMDKDKGDKDKEICNNPLMN